MEQINIFSIILAGITTGGLTCFAVQGGLLTSVIAQSKNENQNSKSDLLPTLAFISSKIFIYTIFGIFLGLFGSFFSISPILQGWIQLIIAIYMIGIALQLLNVHPIFRYFILQPPHSLQKFVRKIAKGRDNLATPALLGLMTIFIPCGTTLAMEALAISTGNPLSGAIVMLVYTISSSWIFFAAGYTASKLNQKLQAYFYKITAAVLVVLGLVSLNGGLNLLGFPYSFSQTSVLSQKTTKDQSKIPADFDTIQKVVIDVNSSGYQSDTLVLKKGVPVEITLIAKNSYSCANAFTIPSLNIQKVLPSNGSDTIKFTPQKSGQLAYSCSMGMYRGNFMVE